MSDTKFTPGPWKWQYKDSFQEPLVERPHVDHGWDDHGPNLVSESAKESYGGPKAILCGWGHDAWGVHIREADARLIAAAPELYAALKRALACIRSANDVNHDEGCGCVVHEACAALAKAVQP